MTRVKYEFRLLLTALMFLTRLPVPASIDHDPARLQASIKYFPVVGWIVGACCSLVFLVFDRLVSTDFGILASMASSVAITGAFHEDGFADFCDGFGGGWNKDKILAIMKDSRLGTFGVIGLVGILGAKFLLLKELPQYAPDLDHPTSNPFVNFQFFFFVLIAGHSLSRWMPLLVIQRLDYVSDPDQSKSRFSPQTRIPWPDFALATIFAALPFLLLSWMYLLAWLPCIYISWELGRYFRKWIGGYTGDCLGAVQQVTEMIFYLAVLLIWRYTV
jgi:adenosylcobinamide-GDP ribazoletransferase